MAKSPINPINEKDIISHNVKFIREQLLNTTQEKFGIGLGATRNQINSYELNRSTPNMRTLVTLAKNHNINLMKLITKPMDISNFKEFQNDMKVPFFDKTDIIRNTKNRKF